jgi:hypothetical protein
MRSADGGTLFLDEIGEMSLNHAGQALARAARARGAPAGRRARGADRYPLGRGHASRSSRLPTSRSGLAFREDLFYRDRRGQLGAASRCASAVADLPELSQASSSRVWAEKTSRAAPRARPGRAEAACSPSVPRQRSRAGKYILTRGLRSWGRGARIHRATDLGLLPPARRLRAPGYREGPSSRSDERVANPGYSVRCALERQRGGRASSACRGNTLYRSSSATA